MDKKTLGFDFETNSVKTAGYNPVVQVGFIYEGEIGSSHEKVIVAKLGMHYANPEAIAVHGISPSDESGISQTQMAHQVNKVMNRSKADYIAGFNSHMFDENVARHLFFSKGLNPFEISNNKGVSLDIFKLIQLANIRGTDAIKFSECDKGRPAMKLSDLATANGLDFGEMHDALVDVKVTLKLAQMIRDNDPALWQEFIDSTDFEKKNEKINKKEPLLRIGKNSVGIYKTPFLPVGVNPGNQNEVIGFKLDDPKKLQKILDLGPEGVQGMMAANPADRPMGFRAKTGSGIPLIKLKLSSSPILISEMEFVDEKKAPKCAASMDILRSSDFEKVCRAAFHGKKDYEENKNPEDRLYSTKMSANDSDLREKLFAIDSKGKPLVENFNVLLKCRQFSQDKETYAGLLIAMKYDSLFEDLDYLEVAKKIEEFKDRPWQMQELAGYQKILSQRIGINEASNYDINASLHTMSERWGPSISRLEEKHPALLSHRKMVIDEAFVHNRNLIKSWQAITCCVLEAGMNISYEDYAKKQLEKKPNEEKTMDRGM